ncbi:hypothetical protein [Chitinophaga sp. S165]|uniref:hypothetical protein n=1 Tax=Chitinophaga sp. S165 TaxID=2135462 RepID=UPI000D71BF8A|nr:hypothetical protein [Chitinophaga sp. S165]PWV51920.1 hypothetical protein C7475_103530 [Chitinophaga sp. S165]
MTLFIRTPIILLAITGMTGVKTLASQRATMPTSGIDTTAAINVIRAEYRNINTAKLTTEAFKYEAEGCVEEGQVKYFLNQKKEIVKIVESGSIGDGSWNREFYFQSGKFIFCYETLIGGPAIGPETKTEHRTYVKDDQVLRYMDDKNIVPAEQTAADALKISYKLLKAYTTKKFAEVLCQ